MIRCLIVDDSASFRAVLRSVLSADPDIEIAGEAADGVSAVERAVALRPDVITLDVEMPGQDGLATLEALMRECPTPILILGAQADDERLGIAFRALRLGAVEVLSKPSSPDAAVRERQVRAIRQAVLAVAGVKVVSRAAPRTRALPALEAGDRITCVGLAASTGGPAALRTLLSTLPRDFPAPVLVVQHILEGFCTGFARWLGAEISLPVRLAQDGDRIAPGTVYLAPSERHLLVSGGRLKVDAGPAVRGNRPSANLLFSSLAREYGRAAAGVVLTGMGDDGAQGLEALRRAGGFTAAQGPESSAVYGMPRAALDSGAASYCLELGELPALLERLTRGPSPQPAGGKKRLLLVDDSRTVLALEEAALSDRYELHAVRDGREALVAIERLRPHGVLLDLNLPGLNGDQTLQRLRETPRHRALPVILVTGERDPVLRRRCWELGCSGLVEKPIDPRRLREAIERVVPP